MKKYLYHSDFSFDREVEIETDYFGKEVKYQYETRTQVPQVQEKEIALYNKATDSWDIVENHIGEVGFIDNKPFRISEYGQYPQGWTTEYVKSLQELKEESKQNLEVLTARLRAEEDTFNGITVAKTYENINEWLTFAKYKNDPNITIPSQAVMMSYSGQNMNAFSVMQIEGAMYQAMQAITAINADYHTTIERIENAKSADELPNITI